MDLSVEKYETDITCWLQVNIEYISLNRIIVQITWFKTQLFFSMCYTPALH